MHDFFEVLGAPRRYSLDLAEVERLYLAKSRALHPDFHQMSGHAEQQASLSLTAELNEAYLALKDPFRRTEHLLNLHGGPPAAQEKNLDQSFLMEMMDLRERIDEAKAKKSGLDTIGSGLRRRLGELLDAAGRPFDAGTALPPELLRTVRRQLNAAKTIMSLLRDLESD